MQNCNQLCSPIKKLFNGLHSLHTYVNYRKTHMATRFGGMGNAPIEDPRTQEPDNGSGNEFQDEDITRQVLAKMENIKQFVEEKYHKPRDTIQEIEQRLNDLSLALHQQHSPIKNVLDWSQKLCAWHRRKHP